MSSMDGYPYSLNAIGTPSANTASVGLYFTVNNSEGEPVGGLNTSDFIAKEDGQTLDPYESAFRAEPAAGRLKVPTVLLLDLSRSVVQAGALETVKMQHYKLLMPYRLIKILLLSLFLANQPFAHVLTQVKFLMK